MRKILSLLLLTCLLVPLNALGSIEFTTATANKVNTNYVYSGGDYTLEFWFYLTNLSQNNGLIAIDESGAANNNRSLQVYVGTGGVIDGNQFTNCSGATANLTGGAALSAATWYYARYSWNGSTASARIFNADGTAKDSASAAAANICSTASTKLSFARASQNIFPLSGRIRNVWFSNVAVTSDSQSIARMFSSNPVLRGPSTASHFWPFTQAGDVRDLLSRTTSTETNTPTTASDPPAITRRY